MGIIKIDNPKIELTKIIAESKLSDKQKDAWFNFINIVIEQDTIPIIQVLQEDATTLDFLTENLEEKFNAIKSGDKNNWKEIIKKEKEFIEKK